MAGAMSLTPKKDARGGKRPGAGRPRGSKNTPKAELDRRSRLDLRKEFRELLEPCERAGVMRMTRILLDEETKDEVAVEAFKVICQYRHGTPQPMVREAGDSSTGNVVQNNMLVVGGDEQSYIGALRQMRKAAGRGVEQPSRNPALIRSSESSEFEEDEEEAIEVAVG